MTVEELYELYRQGATLLDLAELEEISIEGIRQRFVRRGLPLRSRKEARALIYPPPEQVADEQRTAIISAYKEVGSVDVVAEQFPELSKRVVRAIIDAIPDRVRYQRRGVPVTLSREHLLAALGEARNELGEPLSRFAYSRHAAEHGWPALNTIVNAFAEPDSTVADGWVAALRAAGIAHHPSRGRRSNSLTSKECVEAIRECFRQHGRRVSFETYDAWAREHQAPSGASVRTFGRWNEMASRAMEDSA